MTDLLHLIERVLPHEWVTRSNLAERLLRWAESGDPMLMALAYALVYVVGSDGYLLDARSIERIHLRLMVCVVESNNLQDSNLGSVLMRPYTLPNAPDEEANAYLCRIAAKARGVKRRSSMIRSFVDAADGNEEMPTLSPAVIEAWRPLVHEEILTDAWPLYLMATAVRMDPAGTWGNPAIRKKIVANLSRDMKTGGTRLVSEVMAAWPESGIRHLLREARAIYKAPKKGLRAHDILNRTPGARDTAMRTILAAAGSRYPHLLTEDEALVLCMSPNSSERQIGVLASGEATPAARPTTRSASRRPAERKAASPTATTGSTT